MNCPICGTVCDDRDFYCFRCGAGLQPLRQPKKGTHLVPILILLLLTVLGTTVFFTTRSEDTGASSEMPWFEVYDGDLYFNERLYTGGSEITVPAEINGETIRGLGEGCFSYCPLITTVILPDTVEELGEHAFYECDSLRGIHLPGDVSAIGAGAFYGCDALEALTIPSGMQSIRPDSFSGCPKLHHVFYDGFFADWRALCDADLCSETQIHCKDGSFYHSSGTLSP